MNTQTAPDFPATLKVTSAGGRDFIAFHEDGRDWLVLILLLIALIVSCVIKCRE
jgi:hypothetical protein